MELRCLRYFLALAEELHFGRTAQRLSVAIQQLEASVGARLFMRNSKSVQLTAAGQVLAPEARGLLAQAHEALQHVRDVDLGQAGSLRIGFVGAML